MNKWVCGIDGGGTKTVAYAATMDGEVVARTVETASNYHVVGVEEFKRVILSILMKLTEESNKKIANLQAIMLGLAGVDRSEDARIVTEALREIGINCRIILEHDAAIALAAGAGKMHGIVLIAGTGSIAYGVNASGQSARAGGFGHLIGDEGSGYDIAIKAIRAALLAEEKRGAPTMLMSYMLRDAGLSSRDELVGFVYRQGESKAALAQLAQAVVKCADAGDIVARALIDQAGSDLANLAQSVHARNFAGERLIKIIACGSIITKIPRIQEVVSSAIQEWGELIILEGDAALGAINIAIDTINSKR